MNKITALLMLLLLNGATNSLALSAEEVEAAELQSAELPKLPTLPSRASALTLEQLGTPQKGNLVLRGAQPEGYIEFGVRSDEIISEALLNLEFTPSPALIPIESQVKVYLNEEMMGVVPIQQDQLGQRNQIQLPLDTRYIQDFNRIKLEFIGHYQPICENPAHSSLWLDVASDSTLALQHQSLALANDLSFFPEPFFDSRDSRPLLLPIVFAATPDLVQQQAAGILASWFGSQSQWRGQQFPTLINELPKRHGVVFATNDHRPDFLQDYPVVDQATIEMISHPQRPEVKLLLVLGRDNQDLLQAVQGIAQGNILFRGASVVVDEISPFSPRQPYDAPNWVNTQRPVLFSELQDYAEQLQADGMEPAPLALTVTLPPDLFSARDKAVPVQLKYRNTPPQSADGSRLAVTLNNQLLRTYNLKPEQQVSEALFHLSILSTPAKEGRLSIPGLQLGVNNQLRFNFDYANPMLGGTPERCETYQQIPNKVIIDGGSSIDFSGYRHFMAMPNLQAFVNMGFPFSRLADLSQTLVIVDKDSTPIQLTTLFNALGAIGADTGYPALGVQLSHEWPQDNKEVDILLIGSVPEELHNNDNIHLLLNSAQSQIQPTVGRWLHSQLITEQKEKGESTVTVAAEGAIAAIFGLQSPLHKQRSVVALVADHNKGYELLNNTLANNTERAKVSGSLAIIRTSGVQSLQLGNTYYVGYLPWWERIWFALSPHPLMVAAFTALSVLLIVLVLWRVLRTMSHKRLLKDE